MTKLPMQLDAIPRASTDSRNFSKPRELLDRGRDDIPKGSKSRDGQIEAWSNDE